MLWHCRFPKDGALRQQWERSVRGEGWNASDNSRLCSSHFDEKWFDRTGQTVRLREGAIPTACDIPAQLEPRDVKPDSIHMSCSAAEAQGVFLHLTDNHCHCAISARVIFV